MIVQNLMNSIARRGATIEAVVFRPNNFSFFLSAPESERKPLSTLFSQVLVYRFEPGSFLPPLSGLSVTVIKILNVRAH